MLTAHVPGEQSTGLSNLPHPPSPALDAQAQAPGFYSIRRTVDTVTGQQFLDDMPGGYTSILTPVGKENQARHWGPLPGPHRLLTILLPSERCNRVGWCLGGEIVGAFFSVKNKTIFTVAAFTL